MPALIAPSPITAIARPGLPASLLEMAKPSAAEMLVELCAAPNGSYSLSERLVKPLRPPPCRMRADAVAAAGDDLVRIALVADVPDQLVVGRVEHIMDGDGQLDDAEARAQDARRTATRPRSSRREARRPAAAAAPCPACGYRPGNWTVSSSGVSGRSDMAVHLSLAAACHQCAAISAIPQRLLSPDALLAAVARSGRGPRSPGGLGEAGMFGGGADAARTACRRRCASPARKCRRSGRCSRAGSRDAGWRHRRWRFRPGGRGWCRRTGRGSGRRCWPRPACRAPSRPPRRCHRRDAGRSKPASASNTDARMSVHCSPRSAIRRAAASRSDAPW